MDKDKKKEQYAKYVREEISYEASKEKHQGEYTLEDYSKIPDERRVELIDGVIYDMASPNVFHQAVINKITHLLQTYKEENSMKCGVLSAPTDVQLDCDDKTIVQPDIIILCDKLKLFQGRIFGAPDFVVEVLSESTRKKDMGIKLQKYKHAGVREYWMVDIEKRAVIVYEFEISDMPVIYSFSDQVPVSVWGKMCIIDFNQVSDEIAEWM